MRGNPALALVLLIIAAVCLVLGVLYGIGAIQAFTSEPSGPHVKHLILFLVLAVVFLIGANFARQRAV